MTKSELVNVLAQKAPHVSHKDMERIVSSIFTKMTDALSGGERIELRGFGTFEVRVRKPRQGRNPKSGQVVTLGVRKVPFFKAGKELKDIVNDHKKPKE